MSQAHALQTVGVLLLLRAFADGCAALTGVEAIAKAVPSFRRPRVKRAQCAEDALRVTHTDEPEETRRFIEERESWASGVNLVLVSDPASAAGRARRRVRPAVGESQVFVLRRPGRPSVTSPCAEAARGP